MFEKIADRIACALSHPWAMPIAAALLALSIAAGALLKFSDTYMLILTLVLSVLAIILLFPIQYSTNRGEKAIQAKLDEILRAIPQADDRLRGIEKPGKTPE